MKSSKSALVVTVLLLGVAATESSARADGGWWSRTMEYEVTITNVTRGEIFTPFLLYTHKADHVLFELGMPASEEIAGVGEAGAVGAVRDLVEGAGISFDTEMADGPTLPGTSRTFRITRRGLFDRLTLIAMLVPSNDAFVALRGVDLPLWGARTYYAPAYDAGSETNDESCEHVPGPPSVCAGEARSPDDDGEGYVHVHAGIFGGADVPAPLYDWKNPVAEITIRRVR